MAHATVQQQPRSSLQSPVQTVAGVAAVALAGALARWVSTGLPVWLGPPVLGLVLGIGLRLALGQQGWLEAGAQLTLKRLLRLAVILFGATLSLGRAVAIGGQALGVIAAAVLLALGLTWLCGRWVGVGQRLSLLIGTGTAICGATAIVTVAPILRADQNETAFALTTIFLFNTVAVLVYPLAGQLLHLPDALFGVWAGTAIHDTSSVLAAAYAYSEAAGQVATVVKLTRTLTLIPLALVLATVAGSHGAAASQGRGFAWSRAFPWFVLGFLAMAAVNSLGWLPAAWVAAMSRVAQFLIVMVLVGVGYTTDFARLRRLGLKPLLLGLFASVVIAVVSLLLAGSVGV